MAGTLRDNRNEIIKLVSDFWAGAPAIVGVPGPYPTLVIADIDNDGNPDASGNKLPFARLRIQHTQSVAKSISKRVYQNNGVITVNLFVNRTRSDAWMRCGELGNALKLAIRSHRGNVYFKDVTLRERPINNGFNQVDVSAAFWWLEFTQIGA